MKPAYQFAAGAEYPEIGYCWFVNGDYCTFLHTTPCTSAISNTMDLNGWDLHVQPMLFRSTLFNRGGDSYIATYVKKTRTVKPETFPAIPKDEV